MTNLNQIEAAIDLSSDLVRATLIDSRPEVLELFSNRPTAGQSELAVEAWRIGIRALRDAYAQASEARLSDIGKSLKEDLEIAMAAATQQQHERIASELKRFLDPTDGELSRRLDRFVAGDGELARRLSEYMAPEGSVLSDSLARQIGEQSLLFRKLSPTDSDGLVQTLKSQLEAVMSASRGSVAAAMDPLNEESPMARFLGALRIELKKSENDRSAQLAAALKALDANDPNSLLSNLARRTHEASATMLLAMNPADPKSPLRLLENKLTELLENHIKSSRQIMDAEALRRVQFESDMRDSFTRLELHRTARLTTIQGGLEFEDIAAAEVQTQLMGAPVVCTRTGNVVGIRDRCKVGDLLARFTDESAWAGTAIVFEFKQDGSYQADKALKELDVARANRDADVGVFVMAQSHAAPDFPTFARHGRNILVTFDPSDPSTVPWLQGAVMLAAALASRKLAVQDTSGLEAIKNLEGVLTEQLVHIAKMRSASEAIRKNNETLRREIQKAEDELKDLSEHARAIMALLSAGHDEAAEREEPISFARSVPAA